MITATDQTDQEEQNKTKTAGGLQGLLHGNKQTV